MKKRCTKQKNDWLEIQFNSYHDFSNFIYLRKVKKHLLNGSLKYPGARFVHVHACAVLRFVTFQNQHKQLVNIKRRRQPRKPHGVPVERKHGPALPTNEKRKHRKPKRRRFGNPKVRPSQKIRKVWSRTIGE